MARPTRCHRVCAEPACSGFVPRGEPGTGEVLLSVDEYEVIRLVDYEKRTHEQCAAQMEISRTTVTEIYESARFKLSDSLVNGKALVIAGGHYHVCRGDRERGCGRNCQWALKTTLSEKGECTMRIAVPYENGQVFQHFGHTQQMKLYDTENEQVVKEQVADTTGSGHGALAGFLSGLKVDVLICGGIGAGAQAGIKLYGGVTGRADDVVKEFLTGRLNYQTNVQCDHHGHEHHGRHGQGHCGEDKHGCSGNGGKCGE